METSILEDKVIYEQLNEICDWLHKNLYYDGYLIRLLDLIGATMVGVKPAELLKIPIRGSTSEAVTARKRMD
ncbi:hypothetical protein [Desulfosporosinus sp. BICA1-9]|uniref:hypothetical protein n=1 Tax=Desulfosporosinus sp. BICA1-9 TaxID=1531958 RepID=UPI00054B280D|nr:hypothetical protein [Desulfosporosinus sp. BICA1-9]KJS47534.1 MAG: hypothetical protein VR66_19220 [Peptococcaceae bacterium BRH_c23]KJS87166.1 MAG: hypothetical protein JL57_14705 [Desulfosporosinus sp. BICA1-9]HBW38794.1 hypothetical protein [Desulfosporosinus sp.]